MLNPNYGLSGKISLGNGVFFGLGGFIAHMLWTSGFNPILSIIIGSLLPIVFSLLIGLPTFRLKTHYFSIGTLGMAIFFERFMDITFPTLSWMPADALQTFSIIPRYYFGAILAIVICATFYFLKRSRIGLAADTFASDEEAASVVGINVFKYEQIIFTISAFFMGLTGGVYIFYLSSYYNSHLFSVLRWSLLPPIITSIGGTNTLQGPILGAIFFVILQTYLAEIIPGIQLIIFGVLFVIVIIPHPGGLVEIANRISNRLNI